MDPAQLTITVNFKLKEFIAATIEKNVYLLEEKLIQAFKMFDLDGSGTISRSELKEVLGSIQFLTEEDQDYQNQDESFWDNLIKEADKNGDGEIDYCEFVEMMGAKKIDCKN